MLTTSDTVFFCILVNSRKFPIISTNMGQFSGEPSKTWQDSKHIRKRTKFLLDNHDAIPTDITFRVGPDDSAEDITAHKLILAIGSGVFHAMFYGAIKETKDVIRVPDVEPYAFRIMLKYLYSEESGDLTMDTVMDALYCAKKYLVLKFVKICRVYVQGNLTPETGCSIQMQASWYGEANLGELAAITISKQTVKFNSPGFLTLPKHKVSELLQRDDLSLPENEVYKAARSWVMANKSPTSSLQEAFAGLIDYIRLPLLTFTQIFDGPLRDQVLSQDEFGKLYSHILASVKPVSRFPTEPRKPANERYYGVMTVVKAYARTGFGYTYNNVLHLRDVAMGDLVAGRCVGIPLGKLHLEIYADVAPGCSQLFRELAGPGLQCSLVCGGGLTGFVSDAKDAPLDDILLGENELLQYAADWVSMVRRQTETGLRYAGELRVYHPTRHNRRQEGETVFAKVVAGWHVLCLIDLSMTNLMTVIAAMAGSAVTDWDKHFDCVGFVVRDLAVMTAAEYADYGKTAK